MTERIIEAFRGLLNSIVDAAPKVVIGLLLLILAIIVAKVFEKLLRIVLVRVRFDSLLEKAGLDKTLQRIGIRQRLNHFIPRLAYFLLLLLFAKTLADALGLASISEAFGAFFAYLPNIVAALLLLILGTAAGQFAGDAVRNAAASSGMDFAPALGRVVSGMIFFIVGIMAISQLKIETEIVRIVTSFLLAAGALAFGLSFGLGTRDITRNVVAGFYLRRILEVGSAVEIGGVQGILKAVTPTHTVVESGERKISIANTTFMEQVSKQ